MTTEVAKDERFCVRVRNLPAVLSGEAVTALLSHYGAVHKAASSGREPGAVASNKTQKAIAAFSSREDQQNAQRRLQTLELAGHHLQVEVVGDVDASNAVESKAQHTEEDSRVPLDGQPPLPKGLPPPLPPFPPPQSSIPIPNSMYAPAPLAPHLGFYTQVLHLMNKMNLPLPFEEDAIPGRFSNTNKEEKQVVDRYRRRSLKRPRSSVSSDQQIVEEEEGSDENLIEEAIDTEAEPVTDTHDTTKKLHLSGDTDGTRPAGIMNGDQRGGIGPIVKPVIIRKTVARQHKRASVLRSSALATAFEESGRDQQQTQRLTRPGVISETELLKEPLMASYDRGAPSSTIVVQNLADTVDQNDLRSVFGYVLPLDVALEYVMLTPSSALSAAVLTPYCLDVFA
ncbi:hypothetical protein BBJ28_00019778 [Nothophytophthora sp. Chile5]|nr:hypothetical protein BBJ28_00019778 [Nothophytophthora sp. Chile5]